MVPDNYTEPTNEQLAKFVIAHIHATGPVNDLVRAIDPGLLAQSLARNEHQRQTWLKIHREFQTATQYVTNLVEKGFQ